MSLFGVASKGNCVSDLFYGTDYQTHRGPEFGGIAFLKNNSEDIGKEIHRISETQFKGKFSENLGKINSRYGIGVISPREEQPITLDGKVGSFALAVDGWVENLKALGSDLIDKGISFKEQKIDGRYNTAEVIANLINQGRDVVDGIKKMYNKIEGSISLVLLNKEGVYAAGDRFPLFIGKGYNSWAVASENCAFPNLKYALEYNMQPKQIIKITESGYIPKSKPSNIKQICAFLWIYTGFPASSYEGIHVEPVRYRCGAFLARRDTITADFVGGIPDSGTGHGIGYAMESFKITEKKVKEELKRYEHKEIGFIGLKRNITKAFNKYVVPYSRPFVKYTPGYGRSYTPSNQETRDLIASLKLIPIFELLKPNLIITEDSIVRGTQLRRYLENLYSVAREMGVELSDIHVRPACPPLMNPCKYNLSTRTREELAARQAIEEIEGRMLEDNEIEGYINPDSKKYAKMVEIIRKKLDVTSLRYQRLDDMVKAIGLPREKLCLYCWNGEEVPPKKG